MICKKCGMLVQIGQYRVNEDGTYICSACEAKLYRIALDKIKEEFGSIHDSYLAEFVVGIIRETIYKVEGKLICVDDFFTDEQLARFKPLKDDALKELGELKEGDG